MKNVTRTALALAYALVLTGCGGGGSSGTSSSSNTPTPNPSNGGTTPVIPPTVPVVVPTMTDLEKAKDLVQTAHLIVTDAQNIRAAYTPVLNTLNGPAVDGLSTSLSFLSFLQQEAFKYGVLKNNSKQLVGSQIDQAFNFDGAPYVVQAGTNANITVTNNGNVVISGTFKIKELEYAYYDYFTRKNVITYLPEVIFTADNIQVTGSNVDDVSKIFTTTIANQGKISIRSGTQTSMLSFAGTGQNTITETYPTAQSYRARMLQWDQQINFGADDVADKVAIALNGVTLATTAPEATIAANTLQLTLEKKNMTVSNGHGVATAQQFVQLVPTLLDVNGQFKMPTPNTDLTVKASIKIDPTTQFLVNEYGQVDQNSSAFINGTFSVGLKGVTQVGNKSIPINLQLDGNRSDYQLIEATNIVIQLNDRTINATAKAAINVPQPTATFTLSSVNGASTTLIFDDNSDLMGLPTVMVGGQSYGTITKQSSGLYTAKFKDNAIIVL